MEKNVLAAASFYKQAYYFNPEFDGLPLGIKKEIKIMCTLLAEKIRGIFTIGFYQKDYRVYVESHGEENDFDYDEIGATLALDELTKDKKELFQSLSTWYALFNKESKVVIK